MPSRKKAQGKARKAKQAAEAQKCNQSNGFSNACYHIGERNEPRNNFNPNNLSNGCFHISKGNLSQDDYDAATSLLFEYRDKYYELAKILVSSSDPFNFGDLYYLADVLSAINIINSVMLERICFEKYYWLREQEFVLTQTR
eukprot:scaffold17713_cov25-Cyclotella_meneghiniana.AAC.1